MVFVSLSVNEDEVRYLSRLVLADCLKSGDDCPDVPSRLSDLLYEAFKRVTGVGDGCFVFTQSKDCDILERAFQLRIKND